METHGICTHLIFIFKKKVLITMVAMETIHLLYIYRTTLI